MGPLVPSAPWDLVASFVGPLDPRASFAVPSAIGASSFTVVPWATEASFEVVPWVVIVASSKDSFKPLAPAPSAITAS